ncbi:Uma2 family endonuclease [Nostoc sp. FACHB-152]|uniref:Uma2 family endonuclease n=1 Tax=unclassified Nostoc TaxID=2593658 RepID=UPI0016846D7E|nr:MULTISPECIES: Uma2 family endonuclease [unclassified Nostoc]MBD2449592.1 Uma2 family endonuclease [Nostoc sp. FACHB-152]MBD2468959.1 Uma2 family endonuclease [Nostoc sp. FACHB-145]
MNALTLNLPSILELTDEQFYQLCQVNRDLRIERSAKGELIIMPPTGGETGNRNIEIAFQLQAWSRHNNLGIAFDSSTCFKLPNGAERSPDASWMRREKWNSLRDEQKRKFPPLCPEFVLELRSETDALKPLQEKMQEYINNGASLGWLIDPKTKQVEIYRSGQEVEILNNPEQLSGENVLPGFILNLTLIFSSF